MRILIEGQRELVMQSRKFECSNCTCVFIADKDEYRYSGNQLDGGMYSCNCPCCGNEVITSEDSLFYGLDTIKT